MGKTDEAPRRRGRPEQPQTPEGRPDISQILSQQLRNRRAELGWTLEELAAEFRRKAGFALSASQVNRIENKRSAPNLVEAYWLSEALKMKVEDLFGFASKDHPFYISRGDAALAKLQDVVSSSKPAQRGDLAHQDLINARVYNYVPLDAGTIPADPNDSNVPMMDPIMQKYLFEISPADEGQMLAEEGLSNHQGEEIIYVLDGEIEFWHQTGSSKPSRHRLSKDDCLHLSSQGRHGFRAIGTKPARALFIFTRPPEYTARSVVSLNGETM